jgi:hypothetical protein
MRDPSFAMLARDADPDRIAAFFRICMLLREIEMVFAAGDYGREKLMRDPSLRLVARDDDAGRIVNPPRLAAACFR